MLFLVELRVAAYVQRSWEMKTDVTVEERHSSFGHAADDLSRILADEILVGRIAPGTHLSEAMLADRFAVSRTPVREALRQIVASGLAERRPHLGVFVASTPADKLEEMFELAADLEGVCARYAARRMSEEEREEIKKLHNYGGALAQANEPDKYDEINLLFHGKIFEGSHNTYLMETALAARSRVLPYRRAQFRLNKRANKSHSEHAEILQALFSGKGEKAETLMRGHVRASYLASQEILERLSQPRGGQSWK